MPATVVAPATVAELVEALHARPGPVRLAGGGSRQQRLPPPPAGATLLQLARLDTIVQLDAGDQTCVVECGVRREQLDAALAAVGLELACPGGGTIGGLFAADACGAATFGGPAPRTLLLGVDGVLADGTAFRSGARVVKSVAGFDVHKLLVGSEGRLFAAARLFLRLQPRPRAAQWFVVRALELARALELVASLRRLAVAPAALQLQRDAGGFDVRGRIDGRASYVASTLRASSLDAAAPAWCEHLELPPGGEVLAGLALPSVLPSLVAALPATAPLLWHGGGRFEVALAGAAAADAVLAALPGLGVHGCVVRGAPERRGRGTPIDDGQARIAAGLRRALDPDGVLV